MPDAKAVQHERFRFAGLRALLDRAAELGVPLPCCDDVGVLLEPLQLGRFRVPNRLVIHPMEGCDAEAQGAPGTLTFRRYERFARGGAGLIWFEATAVTGDGRSGPRQLHLCDDTVPSFERLVKQTRLAADERFGTGHRPLLVLQLTHSGRYSRPDGIPQPVIAQHNPVLDAGAGVPPKNRVVSDESLDRLQDEFAKAAGLAAAAGFDGVDIKACHGYLVSELLAAHARPASKYGGSFENRARFLLDVVGRIGQEYPQLLVTTRINAWDGVAAPYGFGGGLDKAGEDGLGEAVELLKRLHALGCPMVNVSIGNPYQYPHLGRPYDSPIAGGGKPPEHPLVGVARLLALTGRLQQAVPSLPLVGTGYSWLRQFFPPIAAGAVRTGLAGLVGVGRLAFAYPDFARDLAQRGELDPDKVCITCSACSQIMRDGGRSGCVVRDPDTYAAEHKAGRQRARQRSRPDRRT